MRRKVIQDFANVFCQRLIDLPEGYDDLPEGYDLASFVHYASGKYRLSILTGECSHNELSFQSCERVMYTTNGCAPNCRNMQLSKIRFWKPS